MIDFNILKSCFLVFLIVTGNFVGDVFGCAARKILVLNVYAKHIVLICLIYFTIDFSSDTKLHPGRVFYLTLQLWIFYLMVIRMNVYFTVLVAALLFLIYVVDEYYVYLLDKEMKIHLENIHDNKEKKIKEEEKTKSFEIRHKYISTIIKSLEYMIIGFTLVGFITYFIHQRRRGKGFSYSKFILGNLKCSWE